jgi:hypothetical protein
MTIRAQQLKVASVLPPVFEAAAPCISGLRPHFRCGVDVVNIERPEVIKPTPNAFAAEGLDQGKFPFPVFRMLVDGRTVFIPIGLLTLVGAIADFARLAAILARTVAVPSVLQVALSAAIFTRSLAQSVCVHSFRLAAACADDRDGLLSHQINIAREPKYFDIACKRISDALKQPDIFIDKPKPLKQEALDL